MIRPADLRKSIMWGVLKVAGLLWIVAAAVHLARGGVS